MIKSDAEKAKYMYDSNNDGTKDKESYDHSRLIFGKNEYHKLDDAQILTTGDQYYVFKNVPVYDRLGNVIPYQADEKPIVRTISGETETTTYAYDRTAEYHTHWGYKDQYEDYIYTEESQTRDPERDWDNAFKATTSVYQDELICNRFDIFNILSVTKVTARVRWITYIPDTEKPEKQVGVTLYRTTENIPTTDEEKKKAYENKLSYAEPAVDPDQLIHEDKDSAYIHLNVPQNSSVSVPNDIDQSIKRGTGIENNYYDHTGTKTTAPCDPVMGYVPIYSYNGEPFYYYMTAPKVTGYTLIRSEDVSETEKKYIYPPFGTADETLKSTNTGSNASMYAFASLNFTGTTGAEHNIDLTVTYEQKTASVDFKKIDGTYESNYSKYQGYTEKALENAKFLLYNESNALVGDANGYLYRQANSSVYQYIPSTELVDVHDAPLNAQAQKEKYPGIEADDAQGLIKYNSVGRELVSDANGKVQIIGLPYGTYTLKETDTPEGFTNEEGYLVNKKFSLAEDDAGIMFVTDLSAEQNDQYVKEEALPQNSNYKKLPIRLRNYEEVKTTSVKMTKKDAEDDKPITSSKATYYLLKLIPQEYSPNTDAYEQWVDNYQRVLKEADPKVSPDDPSNTELKKYWQTDDWDSLRNTEALVQILTPFGMQSLLNRYGPYQTDASGVIGPIPNLDHGTYYFFEVQSPYGYKVDNTPIDSKMLVIRDVDETQNIQGDYPDPRKPANLKIFKSDQYRNGLDGGLFELYYVPDVVKSIPYYSINSPVVPPTPPTPVYTVSNEPAVPTTLVTEEPTYTYQYTYAKIAPPSASDSQWILPRTDNDYIYFKDNWEWRTIVVNKVYPESVKFKL